MVFTLLAGSAAGVAAGAGAGAAAGIGAAVGAAMGAIIGAAAGAAALPIVIGAAVCDTGAEPRSSQESKAPPWVPEGMLVDPGSDGFIDGRGGAAAGGGG